VTRPTDPDPIEVLRRSNPVDADQLPSANLARIRARVQENTMTENSRGPIRWAIGVAGVTLAAVVALVVLAPRFGGGPVASPSDGGIGGGGGAAGMCIRFDLDLLAQQELAFDGTVTAIDGESVSFAVDKWFRGPGDASVTLTEPGLGGGAVLEGILVDFQVGSRYLVSGKDGVVTGCGYSVPFDEASAADWAAAFGS
jgi:hypothetical protein